MLRTPLRVVAAIGLVVLVGLPGYAIAAKKAKKHAFTETDVGATISLSGTSYEAVYKSTNSIDGSGATVQTGTVSGASLPLTGTDTDIAYYPNGVSKATDTFTIAAPDANGISALSGSGHCTGGTGVHKKEKCSYTFTGTYNTKTTVTTTSTKGTDTR